MKKYDQICVVESLSCNFDLNFANLSEKKLQNVSLRRYSKRVVLFYLETLFDSW